MLFSWLLSHLGGLLHELGVVLLNVVPRSDGCLQLLAHHHPWALSGRAPHKGHDASARAGESALCGVRGQKVNLGQTTGVTSGLPVFDVTF